VRNVEGMKEKEGQEEEEELVGGWGAFLFRPLYFSLDPVHRTPKTLVKI